MPGPILSLAKPPRWLGVVFLVIAAGCWLLEGIGAWSTRSFVRRATRAEGEVLKWEVGGSAHAEIRFALPSGKSETFRAGTFIPFSPGERAPILYLPEQPSRARVDDFGQLWMPHILGFMFGAAFLAGGLWVLLNVSKREVEARGQSKEA
jgi:hypothetical protein